MQISVYMLHGISVPKARGKVKVWQTIFSEKSVMRLGEGVLKQLLYLI